MIDLTTVAVANPTSALHAEYGVLMKMDDPTALAKKVIELAIKSGISRGNLEKMQLAFARTTSDDLSAEMRLDRTRSYVTNFMLKGMGLGLSAGKYGKRDS